MADNGYPTALQTKKQSRNKVNQIRDGTRECGIGLRAGRLRAFYIFTMVALSALFIGS
jgi:hypothetical protein